MQYILSEEEYNELTLRKSIFQSVNLATLDEKHNDLQKFCTLAANHIPIEENKNTPLGCILDKKKHPYDGTVYCDNCPSKAICPSDRKEFSK